MTSSGPQRFEQILSSVVITTNIVSLLVYVTVSNRKRYFLNLFYFNNLSSTSQTPCNILLSKLNYWSFVYLFDEGWNLNILE